MHSNLFFLIIFKNNYFNKIKNILLNEILIYFYSTPLYRAVLNDNLEIVKLLLMNKKIDANIVQNHLFKFTFKIMNFNYIKINN